MGCHQIPLVMGVALVLTSLPVPSLTCKVADWQPMSFLEQVSAAEVAVHARVVDKLPGSYGHFPSAYRGVLQVYCVFKGGPLPANLTVDEMGQLTSCHHTKVDIGEDYILLLKRSGDTFVPDEVNYLSVAFPADQDHFNLLNRTCGLSNFTAPASTDPAFQPRCPGDRAQWGTATDCLGNSAGSERGSLGLWAAFSVLFFFVKPLCA